MDTARPPQFDGTNFLYYKARMACHLEAVDLGVWRVTRDGMKPIKNPEKPTKSDEKEMHFNARAKNCLFESFSMDVFNQVFTLNTAHEIWLKLKELHDGTTNRGPTTSQPQTANGTLQPPSEAIDEPTLTTQLHTDNEI